MPDLQALSFFLTVNVQIRFLRRGVKDQDLEELSGTRGGFPVRQQ